MNKKYNLLIKEPPLSVLPSLAVKIGLDEAIVLQQLYYWLTNPRNEGRVDENGEKWVYNTYAQWQEDNFPFWSEDKIQRIFLSLEKRGLIISRQLDAKRRDMTKFYRLAWEEICAMDDSFLRPSNTANLHDVKMNQRLPETTSHKTDETKGKYNPQGVEWAMVADRKVEESDLQDPKEREALQAFERDMQLPASWEWYPAKATKEREWRLLREFIVKTYSADNKAFEGYNTWRNQPFVKGAKSNTQIKDFPADFEVSWSDYLRANPVVENTNTEGKGFYA